MRGAASGSAARARAARRARGACAQRLLDWRATARCRPYPRMVMVEDLGPDEPAPSGGRTMPIATPEIYNEMLDTAKAGEFAYPAINVTSLETLNAALRGFAEAESDGIVQISTGGSGVRLRPKVKDMVTGRRRARRVRPRRGGQVLGQRRPAHRPLPQGEARHLRPAADRDQQERVDGGEPAVPVAHVGRVGHRAAREPRDRRRAARPRVKAKHHPRGGDRRRRRRGGRRRRRASTRSCTPRRGRLRDDRDASGAARRAATCSPPPSATCTASTSRATSSCAPRSSSSGQEARRRSRYRPVEAVRPGLPRRLGLAAARRSPRR